jgi:CheY-like chemotaxis protein
MGGSGSNRNPDEDQSSGLRSPSEVTSADIHFHVLIVEDNEADVFLIQEAIEVTRLPLTVDIAQDGEQAVQLFDQLDNDPEMPCPALVILDINLPKRHGGDVLKHMRRSRRGAHVPVLVVSTSHAAHDREEMMRLGANGYFRKPSDYDEFMKLGDIVKAMLGGAASMKKTRGRP